LSIYVGGQGSSSAKLVVVGEAPGRHEEEQLMPFVGPSGEILNEAFREAGLDRSELYLTNVVKVRPPGNDIKSLHLIGKEISDFLPQLWQELESINPNCILAVGGTALEALTGNKGIEKYRGSIMKCHKTGHKVVATLHPASLMHEARAEIKSWKELTYIKADVKRAAEQSLFRELRLPDRTLIIARNSLDVMRFFDRNQGKTMCTTDVETYKTIPQCLGWAFSSYEALSVPIFEAAIPNHDLCFIWKIAAEFFADVKIKHMAQNAKFDEKRCRQIGLKWHDVWFDMMLGWHTLFPELPKKLQFISSIITEEPYYKDEGKEYNPKKDNIDRLLLYNAKDADTGRFKRV
jgi:uracil-DNA glycosylase family 4